MKRILVVFIYLFFICLAFGFRLRALLDVRQLLLVIGSTAAFYLITCGFRKMRNIQWEVAGRCALFAGLLQMFSLLALLLPQAGNDASYLLLIGMCTRPMLYALCIWGIVNVMGQRDSKSSETAAKEVVKPAVDTGYRSLIEHGLTRREAEIALLICKGCTNKEIAAELMISEATVKKHISNIFEKTGIVRREEIVQLIRE